MHYLVVYLLKVALSMGILVCFYQFVLRPLTFYKANRVFLLATVACSFLFPLVNLSVAGDATASTEPAIIRWVPATEVVTARFIPPTERGRDGGSFFTAGQWMLLAWAAGTVVLVLKLLISVASLQRLRNRSTVVLVNGIEACSVYESIAPFSFGKKIFLPSAIADAQGLSKILAHELVHVKQWHTVDILLAELACITQWFNPFAWILRNAIRQNLEFIADNHVISTGVGRQEYQLLLLNVMGRRSYGMTSQFNLSSLKNRIMMMNKNSNSRTQLFRFAIIIPLAAILLLAFRKPGKPGKPAQPAKPRIYYSAVVMDVDTKKPVAGMNLEEARSGTRLVTDQNGIVRMEFPADGKRILELRYYKAGYSEIRTKMALESTDGADVIASELVAVQQGRQDEKCNRCFMTLNMGDNKVLEDPLTTLNLYLSDTSKPLQIVERRQEPALQAHSDEHGSGTLQIVKPDGISSVEGDSLVVREKGSMSMHGNVKLKGSEGKPFRGLVILNGKHISWDEFRAITDSLSANYIPTDGFADVTVLSSKDAAALYYGKEAKDGVLIINTRKPD